MTTRASGTSGSVCCFGDYELDRRTLELRKSGRRIKLAPQPARVLGLLASRPGELVRREEIRREIWGEETFVDFERNLNYCLNCIRAVLGDTARRPRYVETLPRRGYRFIAPIRRESLFAEPTLAVLPFANLNNDPARDYFADGITDALITELGRIPAVRVISRQSVLHLKGSSRKLKQIARDLNVDGVVEGAVLHERNRVRLTAQLILMEPERHVWAQSYDCDMSEILRTQGEAARAIAACVVTALKPVGAVGRTPLAAGPGATRVAPEIVETYWKSRIEWQKVSAEGIAKALQHLREITAKAPDFALGLAEHANCLLCMGWWGHAPAREVYPAAKQMALRALAIDDSLGEAHATLGFLNWVLDWDAAAAETEIRRALELSPSSPEAHIAYAICLGSMGRFPESTAEIHYALRLDPTSLMPNHAAAWIYLFSGQPEAAEVRARRTIELFPDSMHGYFVLGWAAWRQGRPEEAVAAFEKAISISRETVSLSFLAHVYARVGRREEATQLLRELDQLYSQGKAFPMTFVVVHAGLGDADAALGWLQTALQLRDDLAWLSPGFPGLDPLRSDPRFAELMRRMGIAQA